MDRGDRFDTTFYAPEHLAGIRETGLLDAPPVPALDRLSHLTSQVLKVPLCLITLLEQDRQFFLSQCGLPEPLASSRESPMSYSLCQHVVVSGEPFVVTDARSHPWVHNNLAVLEFGVQAYLGVPLQDAKGRVLGAMCVIDFECRDWVDSDLQLLQVLASQAMREIALCSRATRLGQALEIMRESEAQRDAMTKSVVHDLRTPLTSLLLSLDAVQMLGDLNEQQGDCLRLAQSNGLSLLETVNSLLDTTELDASGGVQLVLMECEPASLIERALQQVTPLAVEKGLDLQSSSLPGCPSVYGDENKLIRVLVNLLGNAVKFTPPGGVVRVTCREFQRNSQRETFFAVQDSGRGIPQDKVDAVFQGRRLHLNSGGTPSLGLGLSFCKRVVEAHQGSIWLESAPGSGSTFAFSIPAHSK